MAIDSALITKLVKVTNDTPPNPKEDIVYGTIKLFDGRKYVQIDGSDILTPVKLTVDAIPEDRVVVMIKDHKAVSYSDLSMASARASQVAALNDHIQAVFGDDESITDSRINVMGTTLALIGDKIEIVDSDIESLNSNISTINTKVNAIDSEIDAIDADIEVINTELSAVDSDISTLNSHVQTINSEISTIDSTVTTHGSNIQLINSVFTIEDFGEGPIITGIHGMDLHSLNVDNATMSIATIQQLFADSGIIKDVYSEESYVTGVLCGVTIVGDSVQAGTLKADRLVIKGEDGLYYKLNTEGITGEQYDEDDEPIPQTEYNSLNGAVIAAKSVTAEKIVATDLVAFGATIAGFHIVSDAILNGGKLFSGSKSDITDTTNPGIYMDATGQLCIGDSRNFVRYYKDQNDQFRLDIRADSVSFTGIDDIQDKLGRINVGTESGVPFIELSAEGSDFKLRVTNSRISFIQGSAEVAWISNQKLYIEQAEIRDELRFGNFVWALHGSGTNKNMGLMWKE